MKVSKEQKEQNRIDIIKAAEEGFRQHGYGGLGIDGLTQKANVTSGAFYGHFKSKNEAFKAATIAGITTYIETVESYQESYKSKWLAKFIDFYLNQEHCKNIQNGCVIPGLASDIIRSPQGTRDAYNQLMEQLVHTMIQQPPLTSASSAWHIISTLAGTLLLARSIDAPNSVENILSTSKKSLLDIYS